MLERVIENWLDNATERNWQQAFCTILVCEGHTVLHSTRHNAAELGVDVLAVNPLKELCAYQLKSSANGTITQGEWREISSQVDEMVCRHIVDPSGLSKSHSHRSFLVTNSQIDENVQRSISDRNLSFERLGHRHRRIETIARGEFLRRALNAGQSLWPSEVAETKILLELLTIDGRQSIPPAKLSEFLESFVPLSPTISPPKSRSEILRRLSAGALALAICLGNQSRIGNHFAEVAAWTQFGVMVLGVAERCSLTSKSISPVLTLAKTYCTDAIERTIQELQSRQHLLEPIELLDAPYGILPIRITLLSAILAVYWLERRRTEIPPQEVDDFVVEWIRGHWTKNSLWGEGAVPCFLMVYWLLMRTDASMTPEKHLIQLVQTVVQLNQHGSRNALAPPFISPEEVLKRIHGFSESFRELGTDGSSYSAEALFFSLVRLNRKNAAQLLWDPFSRLTLRDFVPADPWHFYRYQNKTGKLRSRSVPPRKTWRSLREEASLPSEPSVPKLFRADPFLLAMFLIVAPHRLSHPVVLCLEEAFAVLPQ